MDGWFAMDRQLSIIEACVLMLERGSLLESVTTLQLVQWFLRMCTIKIGNITHFMQFFKHTDIHQSRSIAFATRDMFRIP